MKRTTIRSFCVTVTVGIVLSTITSAQEATHQLQLRQVATVDAISTELPKQLKGLEKSQGVIGVVWSCDPSSLTNPVTPYVALMSISPTELIVGQIADVEIAIANLCETPMDVPVSTTFVGPATKEVQRISILKLGCYSEDDDFTVQNQEFLFGATDQAATVRRLMRGDFIRVRMKIRITRSSKTKKTVSRRQLSIFPFVHYWERNSENVPGGLAGPYPTNTMGGSGKNVTISEREEHK